MNTDTEILNLMSQAIQNYIGKIKEKTMVIFKNFSENALDKIQYPFI